MKKLISIMMILALFSLVAVGCSNDTATDDTYKDDTTEVAETEEVASDEASEPVEETEEVAEEVEPAEPVSLKVIAPYGTPTLSMVKMMAENPAIAEGVTVEYEAIQATDVLSSELIKGNADFAIIPTNLAAVLRSKGANYQIAGSSVWGVLYIVSTEEITSMADLKGKNIAMIGRNLTPDAMFRYLLTENGIDPEEDVTLEYYSGSTELAGAFIGGQNTVALIPQPLLTNVLMKKEGAKVVIDLQEEWGALTGESVYPLSSIVVKESLVESHPEVVEAFLAEFETSVNWLNDNPSEAGVYYEGLSIGLNAAIIEQAIPACNLTYVSSTDAKDIFTNYLDVLYTFNPAIVGGVEPDEALYFEK